MLARAAEALGAEQLEALRAATLDHPALECERSYVIHGAVEPARVLVTIGETTQVEALTRPGEIVGGDPLFDLAHALLPQLKGARVAAMPRCWWPGPAAAHWSRTGRRMNRTP